MLTILQNKKILIIGAIVILVLLILIALSSNRKTSTGSSNSISPTLVPTRALNQTYNANVTPPPSAQGKEYQESLKKIDNSEGAIIYRESRIGSLLDKLPYNGTYISLTYNYSTAEFDVKMSKAKETEANDELNTFLQKNGVDRTWMDHLNIIYQ